MFEDYQICPYTGLRSFTEEESLYFKGREDHIEQATEQLQRNKFLMLTGASGDGKSSLVYAGIVPNARAGFLKSKYTQWNVADFRPERTPFKNLCRAIAKQLDIGNPQTVESELQHGFSALVDLYRNSKCFVDVDSVAWQQADDSQRAALKRSAANLMIIVDQFEEFFTNPENYHQGVPSRDSNLALNVLLETARIALEEDLPIYIVFTMRSDYIGQCAAFRSLPEYIGFSQFFVPRLNRSQLQQVIEEPATLSGNQISRRLTERLIHDIAEGVDQLPILQHALNQIWHAANSGKEELDLIHYAMVGGMPSGELPEDQVDRFVKWFAKLPEKIKECYQEPNLQNVLDTHANKLYESAAESYRNKTGKSLFDEVAKQIIKTTFTCLTKIDQSRAVRNRMTLKEIYKILNRRDVDVDTVGWVLNIFRESGNTFIRPFITDDPESGKLEEETVLDITHESLIRNWEYLEQWAKEEFDNYSISLDFEQQLTRWVKSEKSNGFLLSIGQLTYFENWYNRVKPNVYWIARYLPEDIAQNKKLTRAKQVLGNAQEFLQRSARKHAVTRTVMRYGARRIAAVLGVIAILLLSSFVVRDYFRRQNDYVLKSIHKQALALAANPKATYGDRLNLLAEELRLGRTTVKEIADHIQDPFEKEHITAGIATLLVIIGGDEPKKEIFESLQLTDSLLGQFEYNNLTPDHLARILRRINEFRVTLEFAYQHNPDPKIDNWRKQNAKRSAEWVSFILEKQPVDFHDVQNFNLALENAINYSVSEKQLTEWLTVLSPFENPNQSDWLKTNYHKDKLLIRGAQDYGFRHNGLYQLIAYLYAAKGNSEKALQCVDTLLRYSQQNYQQDYAAGADNAAHITATFFQYGKTGQELDVFVKGYSQRKGITEEEFFNRMIGKTLQYYFGAPFNLHLYWFMDGNSNLILQFPRREMLSRYFNKYRTVIESTISNSDEKHFQLALSFKNEGILKSLSKANAVSDEASVSDYFEKAVSHFGKVDSKHLNERIPVLGISGADQLIVPRQFLFVYPDIRYRFHPQEPRSFMFFYYCDSWMNFILEKDLFDSFYPTTEELNYLNLWFKDYNQKMWVPRYFVAEPIRTEVFSRLEEKLATRQDASSNDLNWMHLYAGYDAQMNGDTTAIFRYYRKLKPGLFLNLLRSKDFPNQTNGQSLRMISHAVKAFAMHNHFDEAYNLMAAFKKPINRSSIYAFASAMLQLERANDEVAQRLLDSSMVELKRVGAITTGQPHRQVLAFSMTLRDPEKYASEANQLIKNLNAKSIAQQRMAVAYGFHGKLFPGVSNFPPLISDTDQAIFLRFLLYGYGRGLNINPAPWRNYEYFTPRDQIQWINYIDENI